MLRRRGIECSPEAGKVQEHLAGGEAKLVRRPVGLVRRLVAREEPQDRRADTGGRLACGRRLFLDERGAKRLEAHSEWREGRPCPLGCCAMEGAHRRRPITLFADAHGRDRREERLRGITEPTRTQVGGEGHGICANNDRTALLV